MQENGRKQGCSVIMQVDAIRDLYIVTQKLLRYQEGESAIVRQVQMKKENADDAPCEKRISNT